MSLLLFVGLLISSTSAFYHVFKDSSTTFSYMAQISTISTDSFDLIIYQQSPYSSSPICADCIVFNGTLQTYNIPLSQHTISFHIKSNNIYIFLQCPLLLTISITLPSYQIQYIPTTPNTPNTITNNQQNDIKVKFRCVFQQQADESLNSINYIMYNQNSISLYQYHFPLKLNQFIQHITTPYNTSSSNTYLTYNHNILYFISLSNTLNLAIACYNFIHQTWHKNDAIFSEISFNKVTPKLIQYAGIHFTKNTAHQILNIFFHSNHKYEILSWLIHTDIYSIHEYNYNALDTNPIVINDYNIHIILSPITDHNFIYYNNMDTFLKQISYTAQYMQISHTKRRRLQKTDPECRDVSESCSLVAHDCDDEVTKEWCRSTCDLCQQRTFNCSDYKSSSSAADIDVCLYPRTMPSFCGDSAGWYLFFCPITCQHPNCTDVWMTINPTPMPTIRTTMFESTGVIMEFETTFEPTISTTNEEETKQTDIRHVDDVGKEDMNDNDMSLILILLAVLLMCVFMAGILLWICTNIVRLQKDRNTMRYNAVAAMSSRTPNLFTLAGGPPSTPDYYRTGFHRHTHADPLRG